MSRKHQDQKYPQTGMPPQIQSQLAQQRMDRQKRSAIEMFIAQTAQQLYVKWLECPQYELPDTKDQQRAMGRKAREAAFRLAAELGMVKMEEEESKDV